MDRYIGVGMAVGRREFAAPAEIESGGAIGDGEDVGERGRLGRQRMDETSPFAWSVLANVERVEETAPRPSRMIAPGGKSLGIGRRGRRLERILDRAGLGECRDALRDALILGGENRLENADPAACAQDVDLETKRRHRGR